MENQRMNDNDREERLHEPEPARAPGGLTWPIRRFFWFVEKHFLWRISDSFKRISAVFSRGFRYRSPSAYIGATMLLTLTGVAIAAAVYFHNEARVSEAPLTAQIPTETNTVIAANPAPVPDLPTTPPSEAKDESTLKGVVPDFDKASSSTGKKSGSDGGSTSANKLPATVVKPSAKPDSPPLKVAHNFATTFVDYEVGKKGVTSEFEKTTTAKLFKELKSDPPRLPSNGRIPRATVMNVVKGSKNGDTLEVSVSLMRSGATSELRLALLQGKKKQWLVSEVRG